MFVYQVQVTIDQNIKHEWIEWMIEEHIPNVLKTGLFINAFFFEALDNPESNSFIVQYHTKSIRDLNDYKEKFSTHLQKEHSDKFMNKFKAFRSVFKLLKSFEVSGK